MEDTKYRQSRKQGLNKLADMLGGLSGNVVKEKRKRKKKIKQAGKDNSK